MTKKHPIMNGKSRILTFGLMVLTLLIFGCKPDSASHISLAGEWQVKLDSLNKGTAEKWPENPLDGTPVTLPGTLDHAGLGAPDTLTPALNNYVLSNLTRKHEYEGKAWYQKYVDIPEDWKGKEIALKLERVLWKSDVFVDGTLAGTSESLVGSHDFDLSKLLTPGKHTLTVMIDNSNLHPLINVASKKYPDPRDQDLAHAYTNHTQIKWNGILGEISLTASVKGKPKNLQVYPDLANDSIHVFFETGKNPLKDLRFEILDENGNAIFSQKIEKTLAKGGLSNFSIQKPGKLKLWDEFHPNVYKGRLTNNGQAISTSFGYRKIEGKNGELTLNNHRIFLRGNLECVIFPLTGHPPMNRKGWADLMEKAKDYGLNHLRFHSWCPPEAAFEAADEAGMYLQVELPQWSLKVGEDPKTTDFLKNEADKILKDYGNHPSFILMSMGNELQGDMGLLNHMVEDLRKKDDRHLYTTTTFSFQKPTGTRPEAADQFFVTQWTDKGWIRGQGIFNDQPPGFNTDYSANCAHINVPLISHEIGQYSVYPDLNEIPKYSGVLEPLNFIAIKNDLDKKGMLDLAPAFTQASGKLAAMLYKEEIERALKTSTFDGFQLLQLQDYPGQGTALVGVLNAFWKSKGIISAKEFRKFNSPVVPLLRFKKAVYEDGEDFEASLEIANFLGEMNDKTISWSIKDNDGKTISDGKTQHINLKLGTNQNLGKIQLPIQTQNAQQWTVTVRVEGTQYRNDWPIWVYPKLRAVPKDGIRETTSFAEAIKGLKHGKKVLLNPDFTALKGVEGRFVPVFWSPVHFPDQPGTMGLLIDKDHKALADFPTESYTQWQWWDLCKNSKSIIMDSLSVTPIVRVIDNFVTNSKLGNIFEAKVGRGKLIFSAIDLHNDLAKRPAARQLRNSLIRYMGGDAFDPQQQINFRELLTLKKLKP